MQHMYGNMARTLVQLSNYVTEISSDMEIVKLWYFVDFGHVCILGIHICIVRTAYILHTAKM